MDIGVRNVLVPDNCSNVRLTPLFPWLPELPVLVGVLAVAVAGVGHFSQGVVSFGNCKVARVFLDVRLVVYMPLGCPAAVYGRDRRSVDSRRLCRIRRDVGNYHYDDSRYRDGNRPHGDSRHPGDSRLSAGNRNHDGCHHRVCSRRRDSSRRRSDRLDICRGAEVFQSLWELVAVAWEPAVAWLVAQSV